MKCKQIRSLIYDYEDGATGEALHSAIENHLAGCKACRHYYETQRRLHRSMADVVTGELAGLHFTPKLIKTESFTKQKTFWAISLQRIALAASCFIILCAAAWMLWKPINEKSNDPAPSAYAEAYHYLDIYRTDSSVTSGIAAPLAVIIQPGVPARIVELDGATNVSDALK